MTISVSDVTDKVAVDLSGAAQTMLATLYLKALDADFAHPVLGDRFARQAVQRLDYDFPAIGVSAAWAPLITVRTALYDLWARQFLAAHPECTVIHLGCGMDARVFRLNPGPEVRWFDVDYPEVVALREQVYPTRPHYELLGTAATDLSWLQHIPTGRPTLLLAEGISMYLTAEQGVDLLRAVTDRFATGEVQIDFYNWLAVKSQRRQALVRATGSSLHWAVNSPAPVLRAVPGLRLLIATTLSGAVTLRRAARGPRAMARLMRILPPVRDALQYHRYAFGPVM